MNPQRRSRSTSAFSISAAIIPAMLLLAALQYYYWDFSVDDAFITFRYAENLADGHGVVFNAGERVEGYTNFLWLILLSALHMLGANTVLVAKLLGVACGLMLIPVTALLVQRCAGERTWAAPVAAIMLAGTPALGVWSVAGLETTLFALLVSAGLLAFLDELDDARRFPVSSIFFVLSAMTRPEGVLVFLVSAVWVLREWRREIGRGRQARAWLAIFVFTGVAYMAWRWWYFGYPLPNTFYAKTGRGLAQFMGGVLYTTAGIRKHGGLLLLVAAILPAFWGTARRDASRYLVSILVAWVAYNVYKGHDVLTMFRFFVPMLPVLFALACVALRDVLTILTADRMSRAAVRWFVLAFVAGTLAVNGVLAVQSTDTRIQTREYQSQLRMDDDEFMTYLAELRKIAPENTSIALIDAGVIPYYTGWYTIDRWGLCDEHIAHSKGRGPLGEKYDPDYVLSKKPTFIQTKVSAAMAEAGRFRGWAGDPDLFAHPVFQAEYVRLPGSILQRFYVRREADIPPEKLDLLR